MSDTALDPEQPTLARRIGAFDATMLVMGGIIGSGIFVNPYVVARQVHTSFLIIGAWVVGGLTALAGAFIYAELAVLRPNIGGQYAYLRDAYHPAVAFLYGWALLLVMQTGGMAAVAVTFARYFREIARTNLSESLIAVLALALLSVINCFGVRLGSAVQSTLMLLKIAAIAFLLVAGFAAAKAVPIPAAPAEHAHPASLLSSFGAATVPVLFAYGGWQTSSFMTGEMRDPKRDLARALLFGVAGSHGHLPRRQYRVFADARACRISCHNRTRVYRDAASARRVRRTIHGACDQRIHLRVLEPRYVDRSARLFRNGSRQALFSLPRVAPAKYTRPGRRYHPARRAGGDYCSLRTI